MRETWRAWKAELLKMRHNGCYPMHIAGAVLPAVVFLCYYASSNWSAPLQISGFLEAVGIAFPVVISILCAKSVALEEGGHFQTFLGMTTRRAYAFLAKWTALLVLAFFAAFGAVGILAAGEWSFLKNTEIPPVVYAVSALFLWAGSIPLYAEHLFLNLRFSRAVSMGVAVTESLVSALFLTGLGDGIWQFVPAAFSARGSMTYVTVALYPDVEFSTKAQMRQSAVTGGLIGTAVCAIIMVWFHFYEGRHCDD